MVCINIPQNCIYIWLEGWVNLCFPSFFLSHFTCWCSWGEFRVKMKGVLWSSHSRFKWWLNFSSVELLGEKGLEQATACIKSTKHQKYIFIYPMHSKNKKPLRTTPGKQFTLDSVFRALCKEMHLQLCPLVCCPLLISKWWLEIQPLTIYRTLCTHKSTWGIK